MEESDQLHDPTTLPQVPSGYKGTWAPKLVCTLWRENQSFLPATNLISILWPYNHIHLTY